MNYSRSKSRIVEFFKEYSITITVTTLILLFLGSFLYNCIYVRVFPGECYINDFEGKVVEPGIHPRAYVTEADTSIQFCAIRGKKNYSVDIYKQSTDYLHFTLNGTPVIATVLISYQKTMQYYYPGGPDDDTFVADFMVVLQDLGVQKSFDEVNFNRECFCNILRDEFNRTTTSERIIKSIKFVDFKRFIEKETNNP